MSFLLSLLSGVSRLAAAIAEHFNLPEVRRKAAAKAQAADDAAEAAAAGALERSVESGDADGVNRALDSLLPCAVLLTFLSLCGGCSFFQKPAPPVIYVPSDRAVFPVVSSNGVSGWFVPNATFSDLLKAAQRAKVLERQQAVSARMDGIK